MKHSLLNDAWRMAELEIKYNPNDIIKPFTVALGINLIFIILEIPTATWVYWIPVMVSLRAITAIFTRYEEQSEYRKLVMFPMSMKSKFLGLLGASMFAGFVAWLAAMLLLVVLTGLFYLVVPSSDAIFKAWFLLTHDFGEVMFIFMIIPALCSIVYKNWIISLLELVGIVALTFWMISLHLLPSITFLFLLVVIAAVNMYFGSDSFTRIQRRKKNDTVRSI